MKMIRNDAVGKSVTVFKHAGTGAAYWRGLWRWGMQRLPSLRGGYALDLD